MVTPYDHVILETFFPILAGVFIKMALFRVGSRLVAVSEKKNVFSHFFSIFGENFCFPSKSTPMKYDAPTEDRLISQGLLQ